MADAYTASDVRLTLATIAEEMIARKGTFTEIDSKLGDGDMGLSMEKVALAVRRTLDESAEERPGKLLTLCALAVNRAAPSTLGTLLSVGMMAVGKAMGADAELSAELVANVPTILADEIALRGKAKEGDKTILDALCPYARTLKRVFAETGDLRAAGMQAAAAAHAGMEATKGKPAKMGRAKWLAERNMDCPDGGAVLCDLIAVRLCGE